MGNPNLCYLLSYDAYRPAARGFMVLSGPGTGVAAGCSMLPSCGAEGTSTTPGGKPPTEDPEDPVGGFSGAESMASLTKPSLNLSMLRSSADLNGRSPRMASRSSTFTTCTGHELSARGTCKHSQHARHTAH